MIHNGDNNGMLHAFLILNFLASVCFGVWQGNGFAGIFMFIMILLYALLTDDGGE